MKTSSMRQVQIKDWDFDWQTVAFRRSVSIIIKPGKKIKVISPMTFKLSSVVDFLEEKRSWIHEQQRKIEIDQRKRKKQFQDGESFYFNGELKRLKILPTVIDRSFVTIQAEELQVLIPHGARKSETLIHELIHRYYQNKGKEHILRRALEVNQLLKSSGYESGVNRFSIRGQSTRWGSCSANKAISLNWKLITFSDDVIDYVICHEIAHIRHMNHSRDFWSEVERIFPGYKKAKIELRKLSHEADFLSL